MAKIHTSLSGEPDPLVTSHSDELSQAKDYVEERLPWNLRNPRLAIICGSGLAELSSAIQPESKREFDYASIPYFPKSTVQGHSGRLLFGHLQDSDNPIVVMVGRVHYYEGYSLGKLAFPLRLLRKLGVEMLITTSAAGALNETFAVGDLVIVMDHVNLASLAGLNPLRGPNMDDIGARFPPLSDAYDLPLRCQAHRTWRQLQAHQTRSRKLHEGVYAFSAGPSYETRAECRMLKQFADLVGMSMSIECIVARHADMRVFGLSLVTNKVLVEPGPRGDDPMIQGVGQDILRENVKRGEAAHEDVLETSQDAIPDVRVRVVQDRRSETG